MILKKTLVFPVILLAAISFTGCGIIDAVTQNTWSLAGLTETGTVISKNVYIRSSYAVVAADLLEVKRGETLEILNTAESANVQWYRVRAFDEDATEGWIEAQHIIKADSLDESKKLQEESKDLRSQATGRLRATSNLRLTPEQTDTNILLRLDNRATFEIVAWKYVRKQHPETVTKNEDIEAAKEDDEPEKMEDRYDIWYRVRLDPSVSPAPMGWVFGRQVDLQVPGDIIYYQTNRRKFVTWVSLENNSVSNQPNTKDGSDVPVTKPGSWVILSRTNEVKEIDGVEPDFDGILVLGFDKYNEEHYTAYSTARERIELWGSLPLKVEGTGDDKIFTVILRNPQTGEKEEKRFVLFKDKNRRLRVTPPEDLKNLAESKKK
jgi:hypothetical protein